MHNRPAFIQRPLALAVAGVWLSSNLLPAIAADVEGSKLEEVIVTANRREQNILDVPYNISSISGDAIESAFTLDSEELLRGIPGVSQVDSGPRSGAQFSSIRIRGLNVDNSTFGDFAVTSVATVSTYVNETPVFANLALTDIDRVEVLRGPQATLYGSGALGGTIKYLLREPVLGETQANVGGDLSNTKGSSSLSYTTSGMLNLPMGDTVALRANVFWRDYAGITDYVNLYELDANGVPVQPNGIFDTGYDSTNYESEEDADTYESLYARLALKWVPSDEVEVVLTYIHQDDDVGGRRHRSGGTDGLGNPYSDDESGAVIAEPSERNFDMLALEVEFDLGFATLTSATSYYDNHGTNETDNTGFYATFSEFYLDYPRPLYTAERTWSDEALIQELRLVSNTEGAIDYAFGVFYRDQERELTQINDYVGFEAYADAFYAPLDFVTGENGFTYERTEEYKEMAVFGELTWHLSDRLHLTGGARYFEVDSDVETFIAVAPWDSYHGEVATPFSSSEDDVLLKVNLGYEFSDDDMLFGVISEGYRRGGNNGVPEEGRFANDPAWQVYDSDNAINYEIGVKGTWSSVRYDVSVFLIDWQDPQVNTFTPNGSFYAVINGDEAESSGVEIQLSGALTDNLKYAFSYVYIDAALSADLFAPTGFIAGSPPILLQTEGARLPGTAEHGVNLALDYFIPLKGDGDITLRVDGFYQSSTMNTLQDGDFQVEHPGFSIWNTSAAYWTDKWSAALYVKNIFNEEGITGSFTDAFGTNPAAEFFGSNNREFISLPRTIGVSFRYNF